MLDKEDLKQVAQVVAEGLKACKVFEKFDAIEDNIDKLCSVVDTVRILMERYNFDRVANELFLRHVVFAQGVITEDQYKEWIKAFYDANSEKYAEATKPIYKPYSEKDVEPAAESESPTCAEQEQVDGSTDDISE